MILSVELLIHLTILAIAKFAIKKNIFGDAEQLVDNVLGKSGLIASFTSLVKNIREGDATLNDYASVASATAQTALNVAKLAGKKVGPVAAAFIIFDMINLLHQYFSCEPSKSEPPKKETPTTDPAQRQTSPLVIDLDFNSIETLASNRGIYFDLDNNGFAENTAWVRYTDGLLALDLNNNGLIDNGSELFGNQFSDKQDNGLPYTQSRYIAQIVFDDGTVWDAAAIKQQVLTGTDSEDVLSNSFVEGGTLYGLAGDDRLYGGSQQDILIDGEGADNL